MDQPRVSRTNNLAWALVIAAVTLACPPAIADTLAQLRKEADECQSGFDSATLDVGQPMTSAEWIDVQIDNGDLAHAKWATARFQSIVEDGRARRSVSPKRSELGKRPVTNEAFTEITGNSRSAADSKRIGASEKARLSVGSGAAQLYRGRQLLLRLA